MVAREYKLISSHIYEPMILGIDVRCNEYCQYIENTVSLRDLLSFICEEPDDMTLLLNILRVEMKLNINVIHSNETTQISFKSKVPINELRKFGGEIYLLDCFKAPYPILNYLCQHYKLQNVLIGNENIARMYESLPNHLTLVYSPTCRIQIKNSKY